MTRLEQGIADAFNEYMREQCVAEGKQYHAFSLGPQDMDAAADYLVSDADGFALIEFKYSEDELWDEAHKQRRENLCRLLEANVQMREVHDRCHFIVWMDSKTGQLMCAPYRAEICNKAVFPKCTSLIRITPDKSKRVLGKEYCQQFMNPPPPRHVGKSEFNNYFVWLLKHASRSEKRTVELVARRPSECTVVRFQSVDKAFQGMQRLLTKRP